MQIDVKRDEMTAITDPEGRIVGELASSVEQVVVYADILPLQAILASETCIGRLPRRVMLVLEGKEISPAQRAALDRLAYRILDVMSPLWKESLDV